MGVAAAVTGAASIAFIKEAVELAQAGSLGGIVTAPINKEAMNMAGFHYPGHTELLADLTKTKEFGMMIVGGPLKIMFTTTHVAINALSPLLTTERISEGHPPRASRADEVFRHCAPQNRRGGVESACGRAWFVRQ